MKHNLIFLCFSMLLGLASFQTKATPLPLTNPDNTTLPVVSNDNRFIWRHTDGRIAIWRVDGASNHLEHKDYGPFAGWTAINYSDNKLLWRHTDEHISLWSFDGGVNQVQFKEHGPFAGWSAVNYADGKILWRHADGRISLWQVNDNGDYLTHKEYGPFPGFTAVNYADNKVLWRHTDGHISIWTMDGGVNYVQYKEYGPYGGWSAVNVADDKVLWRKTDGQVSLWSLDNNADKSANDKVYGPYTGYTSVSYADNKLIWQHVSGKMSLWTLDNGGNKLSEAEFGPVDGWSPAGLVAPVKPREAAPAARDFSAIRSDGAIIDERTPDYYVRIKICNRYWAGTDGTVSVMVQDATNWKSNWIVLDEAGNDFTVDSNYAYKVDFGGKLVYPVKLWVSLDGGVSDSMCLEGVGLSTNPDSPNFIQMSENNDFWLDVGTSTVEIGF